MINSSLGVFHFIILGFILFITGLFGIIISKSLTKIIFSTIIIFNSICINFIAISQFNDGTKLEGTTVGIFITIIFLIYTVTLTSIAINFYRNQNKNSKE